jgi:hypothetical protein
MALRCRVSRLAGLLIGQGRRNPRNTGDKIAGATKDKNGGSTADAAD